VPFLAHQLARAAACGSPASCWPRASARAVRGRVRRRLGLGLELDYVEEEVPLGTGAASARRAGCAAARGPLVVLNGDLLSVTTRRQLDLHEKSEAAVTLHLVEVDDPARFGCVPTTPPAG